MNQTKFEWTPTFWQGWRESNNPYRQYKSDRDRRLVLELLDLHDGERVLEVGCGYGWISQVLWDTAKINWFGVDQSPEMIQHLRQIPLHGDAPASMADAVRLPFQDGAFDKVLCTGVLMHIAESELATRELVRVLRAGGRLVCSINNALSPYALPVQVWNRRKQGFVQEFRFPGSFRKLLIGTGMKLDDLRGDGIAATVPLKIGKFQFPPASVFLLVQKLDEWAANRWPWLAYEVWFSGVKIVRPCAS
jgi:SAM-dependent methyltransferase